MTGATAVAVLVVAAGGLMVLWLPVVARRLDGWPWWLVAGIPAVVLGVAALIARYAGPGPAEIAETAAVLSVAVAVLGGAPVATAVLRGAERSGIPGVSYPAETLEEAAVASDMAEPRVTSIDDRPDSSTPLRGGLWIGALERAAVAVCLLTGQPGGLALVVAVKGLGRYPELRAPGAAERFIIGTFASFLWAAAAAGVALLLR